MPRPPERPTAGRRTPRAPAAGPSGPRSVIVEIEDLDGEGRGRFTFDRHRSCVAGVVPGERVEVEVRPGGDLARLLRVIDASVHRVTPRCRHVAECGGCSWQHIAYPEQLALKRRTVQRAVDAAVGRGAVCVDPVRRLPDEGAGPWGFRHKVHFAFGTGGGRLVMGHMRPGSRHVFDATECPVHAPRGNDIAFAVKAALGRAGLAGGEPPRGIARHIVSRVGRSSGEVVSTLVVSENVAPLRRVSREVLESARPDGWHLSVDPKPGPMLLGGRMRHLAGRERVREDVAGVTFLVSPAAFFQTNVQAAEMLAEHVLAAVPQEGLRVLDLYSGLGFFALPLARRGHVVTAVEENPAAVADGEVSARFNRIPASSCRFVRAGAEQALERLARRGETFATVVLDPPRAGASERAIHLLRSGVCPRRLVYVSCEPESLARDLAGLTRPRPEAAAYRVVAVTPIDMFPHTAHVEAVAVLDLDGGRR